MSTDEGASSSKKLKSEESSKHPEISKSEMNEEVKQAFANAWNQLDYHDEKQHIKEVNDYGDIDEIAKKELEDYVHTHEQKKKPTAKEKMQVLSKSKSTDNYDGPQINDDTVINEEFINGLISFFAKWGLDKKLPRKQAWKMVELAIPHFEKENSIIDVEMPKNGRIIVCGDTHGQFTDLLTILKTAGLPSEKQTMIFNGDFVDRGPAGIEVLITLYALKIAFPKNFHLNRGNHEQSRLNARYNFEDQVLKTYDKELFEYIEDSFGYLPYGSIIDNKVLVIHGGLFRYKDVDLEELRDLPKMRDFPRHSRSNSREAKVLEDLLWSDPKKEEGLEESKRGAGMEFGPDVTENFLKENNMVLVVRSHQMVDEGFEFMHDGKLVTVFSASYYCGTNSNKGAFLVFEDQSDLSKPTATQYYAEMLSTNITNIQSSCVDETLQKLKEQVYAKRHQLFSEFVKRDEAHEGHVTKDDWCEILETVLDLNIDWHAMFPYLVTADKDNVNYHTFLDRYKIYVNPEFHKQWSEQIISDICEKFRELYPHITEIFHELDTNGDGVVSYEEFGNALQKMNFADPNQIYDLMKDLDSNENGVIEYKEFKDRFKVQFYRSDGDKWLLAAVEEIGNKLYDRFYKHKSPLKHAFERLSGDDGRASYDKFIEWMRENIDISYTDEEAMRIAAFIDADGNKSISWKEFSGAFKVCDTKLPTWQTKVMNEVCDTILQNKVHIKKVFRTMDKDGSGKLDLGEFTSGLKVLHKLLNSPHPFSPALIKKLHRALDSDNDGLVDYQNWLDMFKIVDVRSE
eukprot:Phypoly_transcript_02935.p1 GENE.Phypoly_transcript_02935~~Phypoly_transcript_02935.p1  ORF type:complete len:797 (+),score=153.93 Phypoly_transcript_02935:126-2516(+)